MRSQLKRLTKSFNREPSMLILVLVLVPLLFQYLSNARMAALIAGTLFFLIGVLALRQSIQPRKDYVLLAASLVFLGLFVLPMLLLRIIHWDANFITLSFLGIPLPWLHKNSQWVYLALFALSLRNRYFFKLSKTT